MYVCMRYTEIQLQQTKYIYVCMLYVCMRYTVIQIQQTKYMYVCLDAYVCMFEPQRERQIVGNKLCMHIHTYVNMCMFDMIKCKYVYV
jgi:hypothetical protein